MGGFLSSHVPVPDERMLNTIVKLKLKDEDLRKLYTKFLKCDKEVLGLLRLTFMLRNKQTKCLLVMVVIVVCRCLPILSFATHHGLWYSRPRVVASSKGGTIDRAEFYKSIDEKDSDFGDAIFALIDEDNSGQLDFSEYVEALGKFCILSKEDILKFCFNVFDADKNGTIEGPELTHLMEMLHGEDGQTSNMKQALKSFDFNGDGKIDFQEFQMLNTQFPSLLYPAFRIQQNMKIFTMGDAWWQKKIEELHRDKAELLAKLQAMGEDTANADKINAQDAKEAARLAKLKRQEQAVRIKMGCCLFYCCPCRRYKYVIDEEAPSDDEDSDEEEEKKRKAKEAEKKKANEPRNKRDNVVKIKGPLKPLSKEERLERARKRRMRDMADRPTRKE